MSHHIVSELREGVLSLGINRPERKNALTPQMYTGLADALIEAGTSDHVRVVILHGSEEIFCAGNDIEQFAAHEPAQDERPSIYFMHALSRLMKPVIAAVNGPAVGIGATLLLHCDLVYAGRNTQLVFPFVKLGLCPEFASTLLLPSRLGHQRAAELLLLGEPCDADRALLLGLVNDVLDPEDVLPRARETAARMASLSMQALQTSKTLMREGIQQACEQQIAKETVAFSRLLTSPEAKSAFEAFLKRRKPD
ncbi:enoyl-CoA hydratase [Allopusillimonas ginsengisoli]|uniref:enoyl-CoA hydratase n=1 Tax=Allopusillimonas ginsengisoli TaxID=453575 RepID=UPI001FD66552|nr:enoyl-CoA hydratase [Allopusillimonas ginsengisoli]